MKFIMDKKTAIKVTISTICLIGIFFASIIIPCIFTKSVEGILISGLFGFLLISFIVAHFYPIWFDDYIDKFWKNQKEKIE